MQIVLINGQDPKPHDVQGLIDGEFYQGIRVMTSMLALNSRVVDFSRHLERLISQARELSMEDFPSSEVLAFEIDSLLERSKRPPRARIRVILFQDNHGNVNRIVELKRLEDETELARLAESGVRLSTSLDRSWLRGSHLKTGALGTRDIAAYCARKTGFDDVLWVNSDGELAEVTWGNIFLIGRSGDLVEIATPAASSGLLLGIVRRRISELLIASKIPVTERVITLDELPRFDEAFTTSSIRGLTPVTQIDKHRLQTIRKNAVFNHISRLYASWLKSDYTNNFSNLNRKVDA